MNRCSALAVVLLSVLATAALAEPVRVTNGAVPARGVRTVTLEKVWEVGTEDDDLILGVVNRVLIDDDKNIYLLDGQLAEVHVISPEGELLRTLGREGDGPGEFRQPTDMCFLPGGELGVMQTIPGKLIKLDTADGTPRGDWRLGDETSGGFFQMNGARQAGEHLVVGGVHQIVDQAAGEVTRENFLCYVDPATGTILNTPVTRLMAFDLANLRLDEVELADGPENRYDVLPDGRTVVVLPRNRYEVSIYAPDGTLERVFTRAYESWRRDQQASAIWERILQTIERTQVPGTPIHWEDTEPDVQAVNTGVDGRIWIQNAHGRWAPPEGVFTEFDVFTADGVFDEQVRYVCDGDPRSDMIFFSGPDYVFRVAGFWDAALARFGGAGATTGDEEEPAPVSVTCYRAGP